MFLDPQGWILKKVIYVRGPSGVEEDESGRSPSGTLALRVVPNPSSGPVEIRFDPARAPQADAGRDGEEDLTAIRIVDISGRIVRDLVLTGPQRARGAALWDARTESGLPAASGAYWVLAGDGRDRSGARLVITR
jgi:hypothetical protein